MTREDLKDKIYSILWDKFTPNRRGKWEIDNAVDEIAELFPLPPAEGAETILHRHIDKQSMDELSVNVWPDMLEAMHEFATLHAQQMAKKMVRERLREELIKYDKYIGNKGWIDNYEDETAIPTVDEYLNGRNK